MRLLCLWIGVLNILHWSESFQIKMRSVGVIFGERLSEVVSQGLYRLSEKVFLGVELFSKGSVCALNPAIVLGSFGRQDIKRNIEFLTGLFKLSHKLRPSIDLNGFDGKGCFLP